MTPYSTMVLSRSVSTSGASPRHSRKTSNRVSPSRAKRRISSVQRSPRTDRLRATEQVLSWNFAIGIVRHLQGRVLGHYGPCRVSDVRLPSLTTFPMQPIPKTGLAAVCAHAGADLELNRLSNAVGP